MLTIAPSEQNTLHHSMPNRLSRGRSASVNNGHWNEISRSPTQKLKRLSLRGGDVLIPMDAFKVLYLCSALDRNEVGDKSWFLMFNQPSSFADGKLPTFVFPTALNFYSDDQSSHKQVLTLYNPYDIPLKFKVLCTAPQKYTVVDAEGAIRPRCCVDVVVRHTDICINNEGASDKFRVQISEHGSRKVLGKKDISAVLLPTKTREGSPAREDRFLSLPQHTGLQETSTSSQSIPQAQSGGRHTSGPSFVVIFTAFACIAALMLPLHGDGGSSLPEYLHLSVNQKLIAAYVLGLVTMLILHV